jgi:hypothetical protein
MLFMRQHVNYIGAVVDVCLYNPKSNMIRVNACEICWQLVSIECSSLLGQIVFIRHALCYILKKKCIALIDF